MVTFTLGDDEFMEQYGETTHGRYAEDEGHGPRILRGDQFATQANWKAEQFNSLTVKDHPEAVDAFSQDWAGLMNLLVLPMGAYTRTLVKCAAVGIMVSPNWEAQEWWPMLMSITVRMMSLGAASKVVVRGPSGHFEPGCNMS